MTTVWTVYLIGTCIGVTTCLSGIAVLRMSALLFEIQGIQRDLHRLRLDILSEKYPPRPKKIDFKENTFSKK